MRLFWMPSSSSAQLFCASPHLPALQMSCAITARYASSSPCLQLVYRYSLVMRTWTNPEATSCNNWWTAICKLPTKVANEVGKAWVRRQESLRNMRCSVLEWNEKRMKRADWGSNHSPFNSPKKVGISTYSPARQPQESIWWAPLSKSSQLKVRSAKVFL